MLVTEKRDGKTYAKVRDLKPWDRNPRDITPEGKERLRKQLKNLEQYKPLLVDHDGTVLGGNMRLKVFQEEGIEEVWVSVVNAPTEAKMLEYALSDNDRAGFYIEEQLVDLSNEFKNDVNLDDYHVDLDDTISMHELMIDNTKLPDTIDDVPDAPTEAKSKPGEIYILGKHRLMCGDSTSREDVEKLMAGKEADMVFTDPPYGVKYVGKTKDALTIENDQDTEVFARAIGNYITKPGASFYVCSPQGPNFIDFLNAFNTRCKQSATIIWVKNSMVLGHGDYHYKHEPIIYGWDNRGPHTWHGDRTQTTVWEINRPTRNKEHPTMKPVELVVRAINNSSKMGDIVLDLFGGSGTTLMACETTERVCYTMELDPKYVDVILTRWSNVTGKDPMREDGKAWSAIKQG